MPIVTIEVNQDDYEHIQRWLNSPRGSFSSEGHPVVGVRGASFPD